MQITANKKQAVHLYARESHGRDPDNLADEQADMRRMDRSGESFCCIGCHTPIASREMIPVIGKPQHTFANPGGEVFHIGCFAVAVHLLPVSEPTDTFSWFPGYVWQIVVCDQCGLHLGWQYLGPTRFYGLIMNRLILRQHGGA